jgi:hypothetical protein
MGQYWDVIPLFAEVIHYYCSARCHQSIEQTEFDTWASKSEFCKAPLKNRINGNKNTRRKKVGDGGNGA